MRCVFEEGVISHRYILMGVFAKLRLELVARETGIAPAPLSLGGGVQSCVVEAARRVGGVDPTTGQGYFDNTPR